MTYYDIQQILGVDATTEILNAPDGADRCKASAACELADDNERGMRVWLAFRKMLADGRHRLTDGAVARVGLRVVKVRAWFEQYHQLYHYDERVCVVTSLHFLDIGAVDCGPSQYGVRQLRAADPSPTAHEDLENAARWVANFTWGAPLAKMLREEADAMRVSRRSE